MAENTMPMYAAPIVLLRVTSMGSIGNHGAHFFSFIEVAHSRHGVHACPCDLATRACGVFTVTDGPIHLRSSRKQQRASESSEDGYLWIERPPIRRKGSLLLRFPPRLLVCRIVVVLVVGGGWRWFIARLRLVFKCHLLLSRHRGFEIATSQQACFSGHARCLRFPAAMSPAPRSC